jgi:hypothetical protein
LRPGDQVLLYASRGCYGNPTRDRGRIIGTATVRTKAEVLDPPVTVGSREYAVGAEISIETIAPVREGPELAPLVDQLAVFPHKHAWSAVLRRSLLTLPAKDARLLNTRLEAVAGSPSEHLAGHLEATRRRAR